MPFLLFFLALPFLFSRLDPENLAKFIHSFLFASITSILIVWPWFIFAITGPLSFWIAVPLSIFYLQTNLKLIYAGSLKKYLF